jgi:puromycin-sensitive aminopeptidase
METIFFFWSVFRWTELWLNEGYATFTEFLAVDAISPEYDIWTQFATDILAPALTLDALESSHAVEVEIRSPGDCSEVFDTISYCKGASLIRMLQTYMGDESFRSGMSEYLRRYAYKNAKTSDLWKALQDTSKLPVTSIMTNWTSQVGFPLVKIAEVSQSGNVRSFALTQEKFCADPKYNGNKSKFESYNWIIPLSVTQGSKPEKPSFHIIMNGAESKLTEIQLSNVAPGEWVKVRMITYGLG